ncbi:hypothetical protein L3X38_032643 [Prunus dulcis]|uniref:Uncharacterized protein n=1 Tax=Prunus dulcis TaxID=3755 RepID=A0AAD4YW29_PRUDU|nr:hypothetical protein L3X38_032643 [Prunus dulcis]
MREGLMAEEKLEAAGMLAAAEERDNQLRVSKITARSFLGKVGGVGIVPLKTQSFLNTEGVALTNFPRHCNFGGHLLELPRVGLFCGMTEKKVLDGLAQNNLVCMIYLLEEDEVVDYDKNVVSLILIQLCITLPFANSSYTLHWTIVEHCEKKKQRRNEKTL